MAAICQHKTHTPTVDHGITADGNLIIRRFSNYPELARWCISQLPALQHPHFAMGHGRAFVVLIEFMHASPGAELELLAISDRLGHGREQLRQVIACFVGRLGSTWDGSDGPAALLYERPD